MESETQAGPKSKKGLYIVGGIVVVLVLGRFVMGGIGGSLSGVDRNGNGTATYSNSDGSVTVGSNKLPANWPSDAPTYPNAQIQSAVASNPQTGSAGSAVVFTTGDSQQKVIDFYTRALATNGWKVEQTVSTGTGTMLSATKDTRNFGVFITDSGDGKVSITASISLP